MPDFRFRAAQPRSLAAVALDLPIRAVTNSRPFRPSSIISKGLTVQPFRAASMAAFRAAFSSSVSLGMVNTAETALKASVSVSMMWTNWSFRARAAVSTSRAWSAYSAYFFLPTVSPQTMAARPAPMAPFRADADPPPGAGASEPMTSANSLTVISVSFMKFSSYLMRLYSITWVR